MISQIKEKPLESALLAVLVALLSGGTTIGTNTVQGSVHDAELREFRERLRDQELQFTKEVAALRSELIVLKEKIHFSRTGEVDFLAASRADAPDESIIMIPELAAPTAAISIIESAAGPPEDPPNQ